MKKNKVLKALGIGAIATLSMFTMVGCSVDLTEEQVDKVMYTVDNSDKFMKETLDLLSKQNAKLNKEAGWNLYKLAKTKLILNDGGDRNNMAAYVKSGNEESILMQTYTDTNGNYYVFNNPDTPNWDLTFKKDGKVYQYNANDSSKVELGISSVESYIPWNLLFYSTLYECDEGDVFACDLQENGNYKVTFLKEVVVSDNGPIVTAIIDAEITSDAQIISERCVAGNVSDYFNTQIPSSFQEEMIINYKYSTVALQGIEEKISTAMNA